MPRPRKANSCYLMEKSRTAILPAPSPASASVGATEVHLPKFTTTMEEGTLRRWLKREGNLLVKGEPLFEMEIDEATVEVETPFSGKLVRILAWDGATLPILAPVALVAAEGSVGVGGKC